jgi:predicted component of type VI protein secretion system
MKIRLKISKKSDPSFSSEMDFNRFPITFGRDEKNDVILADPFKVVSRHHAKIVNTEGILQLVDLESANFTYLNDARIIPNDENALKSGDIIKIGEYELETELLKEQKLPEYDDQKTMVFSSPFAEEINNIMENLSRISEKYALDDSPAKLEMLKFSVMQSFNFLEKNEPNKYLAEYFSEHFLDKKIPSYHPGESVLQEKSTPVSKVVQKKPDKAYTGASVIPEDYSLSAHFTETIDVLLDTFTRLIQGFLQFRQEFFGVTIYHTIPTGSLKEFKEFLFNPDISPEDERKRLGLLKEETSKLLSHQIGLLEGYQVSVTDGSKDLLKALDPEVIEKELEVKAKQSGPDLAKILPFARKTKVLDVLKENYRAFASDPYHIEKKYFRPSFLKGYQKRILSKSKNEY